MNVIVCGAFTGKQKKPCKYCKNFLLWGISTGHCSKKNCDTQTWGHCKFYKRDSQVWTKDGVCKVDENELYS